MSKFVEKDIRPLFEALRFIENGCEAALEEYEMDPCLRDIIEEFMAYATIRNDYLAGGDE